MVASMVTVRPQWAQSALTSRQVGERNSNTSDEIGARQYTQRTCAATAVGSPSCNALKLRVFHMRMRLPRVETTAAEVTHGPDGLTPDLLHCCTRSPCHLTPAFNPRIAEVAQDRSSFDWQGVWRWV